MLNAAAVQSRAPIGSPMSTALSTATSRIFTPSTGVATETSPVLSASNVRICPPKKSIAAIGGCHQSIDGRVPPSGNRSVAARGGDVVRDSYRAPHISAEIGRAFDEQRAYDIGEGADERQQQVQSGLYAGAMASAPRQRFVVPSCSCPHDLR